MSKQPGDNESNEVDKEDGKCRDGVIGSKGVELEGNLRGRNVLGEGVL